MKELNLNRTFKEFLRAGVDRKVWKNSPEADFANDVFRDLGFKDFDEWDKLRNYLIFKRACAEAIEAAEKLFKKWKASQ